MTTTKKTKPECKYKAPTKKRKKWKNKPKKAKRSSTVKNATKHVEFASRTNLQLTESLKTIMTTDYAS